MGLLCVALLDWSCDPLFSPTLPMGRGSLWLHQQGYADKLRRRFINEEQGGLAPKTPVSVDAYAGLIFNDEEAQEREEEEYRQKVGSLQFAAMTTRPHIAFAYSKLGSGLTVRSDQHWHEVDRCLAYLADTRDTALEFGGGPELLELIGYVDADDAGDKQNRTSTGGYVFVYGGAAVSCEVLALPSLGQRRRLGRMYGSSSRPSLAGELLDRLRRAAGDRCDIVVDLGDRQLQLTGLGDGWAVDQEGLFDREVDGGVRRPERQRWTVALLQHWHTVDMLCWQVAFLQCWRGSSTQRWQAVDHAVLPAAAIVTMVNPVPNAGVADTLEARLADARKRHADGEYGTIPLLIVELGIQSQWATEYPSRPVSPRPVRNEGGVDNEVNGGARVSGNDGMKQRGVIKVDGGVDRRWTGQGCLI
ncbi:unnamed protein product [Closterium sp. NIES-53]